MVPIRLSLRDLAKKLRVSHATVSLALRNHPRISIEVRHKIQETAKALGYVSDPMLEALPHQIRTKKHMVFYPTIAWVTLQPKAPGIREIDEYWNGALAHAGGLGYYLEEFVASESVSASILKTEFENRNVCGILLSPVPSGIKVNLRDFPWNSFAIIRLDRSWSFPGSHIVTDDQFNNARLAFMKAVEYGYKRIGFVGNQSYTCQFAAGYHFGQNLYTDIDKIPLLIVDSESDYIEQPLLKWIEKHRPDILITGDARIYKVLDNNGIKCPQDLALVGLGLDSQINAGFYQQCFEIGRVAAASVISMINEQRIGIPEIVLQTVIPGVWVDGSMMPRKTD